jgi:alkaline phosphatase D
MRGLLVTSFVVAGAYASVEKLTRNLVFRSPFLNEPQVSERSYLCQSEALTLEQLGHDIEAISRRSIQHAPRDAVSASKFKDEPYPGFYTSDFSNVWLAVEHHYVALSYRTHRLRRSGAPESISPMQVRFQR